MQQPQTATSDTLHAALQKHEDSKAQYLALRERLTTLGHRLEKHRKAATAATGESERAGEAWRAQLRDADGELTKDIKQLKRQELDTRELAEEFNSLVNELQPEYDLCQLDVFEARERYASACHAADVQYADHCLAEAYDALLALPAGARLLDALSHRFDLVAREISYPGTTLEQYQTERERTERRLALLSQPILAALASHEPSAGDATRQQLAPLATTALEDSAPDLSSQITRKKLRERFTHNEEAWLVP